MVSQAERRHARQARYLLPALKWVRQLRTLLHRDALSLTRNPADVAGAGRGREKKCVSVLCVCVCVFVPADVAGVGRGRGKKCVCVGGGGLAGNVYAYVYGLNKTLPHMCPRILPSTCYCPQATCYCPPGHMLLPPRPHANAPQSTS